MQGESSTRGVRGGSLHRLRSLTVACAASFALAGVALSARADCGAAAAPWISLEIDAERVASGEASEFVEIDQAGCVTARYPSFDTRAGLYRYQLEAGAKGELQSLLARTQLQRLDAPGLRNRLKAQDDGRRAKVERGEDSGLLVADGDRYRIAIEADGQRNVIEWYAPLQEAGWRQNVTELNQLVEFIVAVRAAGNAPQKQRVDEVKP